MLQRILAQFAIHVLAWIILFATGMHKYALIVYFVAMVATGISDSFDK